MQAFSAVSCALMAFWRQRSMGYSLAALPIPFSGLFLPILILCEEHGGTEKRLKQLEADMAFLVAQERQRMAAESQTSKAA